MGLGGRGAWLGEHSIRVLAQVYRATPVGKTLSCVYSWVVGWEHGPALGFLFKGPPNTSPQEQHGSEGQLSLLLAAGNGPTHSQAQSKGHFSWGRLVWDVLGISTQAPCRPGDGVYRARTSWPLFRVWAGEKPGL